MKTLKVTWLSECAELDKDHGKNWDSNMQNVGIKQAKCVFSIMPHFY